MHELLHSFFTGKNYHGDFVLFPLLRLQEALRTKTTH